MNSILSQIDSQSKDKQKNKWFEFSYNKKKRQLRRFFGKDDEVEEQKQEQAKQNDQPTANLTQTIFSLQMQKVGLATKKTGGKSLNNIFQRTFLQKQKKKDEVEDIEQNKIADQQEENKQKSVNSKKGYTLDGAKRKMTFIKPPWNYFFPIEFVDFAPDSHILKILLKKIKLYDIVITLGAILGYFIGITENDMYFDSGNKISLTINTLRTFNCVLTFCLSKIINSVFLLIKRSIIIVNYRKEFKFIDFSSTLLEDIDQMKILILDILIMIWVCPPGVDVESEQYIMGLTYVYSASDIIVFLMSFRLFFLLKLVFTFSAYGTYRAERLCDLNVVKHGPQWMLKCFLKDQPFYFTTVLMFVFLIFFGMNVRIFERPLKDQESNWYYGNSFWCIIVTMTTVGYGDFCPKTHMGRIIASSAAISGAYLISLLVIAIASNFQDLNSCEEYTLLEVQIKESRQTVRYLAAKIIQRLFRNHQCKKHQIAPSSNKESFPAKNIRSLLKIKKSKVKWELNAQEILRQMIFQTEVVFNGYKIQLSELEQIYGKLEDIRAVQVGSINKLQEMIFKTIMISNYFHPDPVAQQSQESNKKIVLGKSLNEGTKKIMTGALQKYQFNLERKNQLNGIKMIGNIEKLFKQIELQKNQSYKDFLYYSEMIKVNTQDLTEEYQDVANDIISSKQNSKNFGFLKSLIEKTLTSKIKSSMKKTNNITQPPNQEEERKEKTAMSATKVITFKIDGAPRPDEIGYSPIKKASFLKNSPQKIKDLNASQVSNSKQVILEMDEEQSNSTNDANQEITGESIPKFKAYKKNKEKELPQDEIEEIEI